MDALTFRPFGEVAAFVRQKTDFLLTLRKWSACPAGEFSTIAPPMMGLRPIDTDENEILAKTFRALALAHPTERMALLVTAITVHERRCALAWSHVKANPNPRSTAPRDGYIGLRPYEAMIDVLKDWLEALHDQATGAEL